MHHQIQEFGYFGLKGFRLDGWVGSRHRLGLAEGLGKSGYSAPDIKIKLSPSQP
jgi:hypothetical protein